MKYQIFFYLFITQISFGQWVKTNAPNNQVWTMLVSGELIYTGTGGGTGVLVSTDIGNNWTGINNGMDRPDAHALAISGNNLIAGTGGSTNKGIFISTNNGINWTASGLDGSIVNCLAVSDTNIFAGTNGSLYRSTDNGASWTNIVTGLPDFFWVEAFAVSNNDVFSGNRYPLGVYHSTNNGTNWIEANTGLSSWHEVYALAISGSSVFAGTSSSGIYRSDDNGKNWTAVNKGLPSELVFSLLPNGANLYAGFFREGVFRTTNNGTEWTDYNFGLTDKFVLSLAILDNYIFAGTYSGIFKRSLFDTTTSIQNEKFTPSVFSLNQNYPNPFNPSTKIKYSVDKGETVNLKIFDILGREVETLVNSYQSPGSYEVEFAPKSLSDGVYIYRLQAGDRYLIKKMIYLK